jgi:hypothetical protein
MRLKLNAAFAATLALWLCAQIGSSRADVIYSFSFTQLLNDIPDFNVTITEPTFITRSRFVIIK